MIVSVAGCFQGGQATKTRTLQNDVIISGAVERESGGGWLRRLITELQIHKLRVESPATAITVHRRTVHPSRLSCRMIPVVHCNAYCCLRHLITTSETDYRLRRPELIPDSITLHVQSLRDSAAKYKYTCTVAKTQPTLIIYLCFYLFNMTRLDTGAIITRCNNVDEWYPKDIIWQVHLSVLTKTNQFRQHWQLD